MFRVVRVVGPYVMWEGTKHILISEKLSCALLSEHIAAEREARLTTYYCKLGVFLCSLASKNEQIACCNWCALHVARV